MEIAMGGSDTPYGLKLALQEESTQSQMLSSGYEGTAPGSTVARDLQTTASSGPSKFYREGSEVQSKITGQSSGPLTISELQPTTENAYGGGLYGSEEGSSVDNGKARKPRASESQSVDGGLERGHRNNSINSEVGETEDPSAVRDRCVEVTGQSYFQ